MTAKLSGTVLVGASNIKHVVASKNHTNSEPVQDLAGFSGYSGEMRCITRGLVLCTAAVMLYNGVAFANQSRTHTQPKRKYITASMAGAVYKKFKDQEASYKKARPRSHPSYTVGVGRTFNGNIRADLNLNYGSWKYKANHSGALTYNKQKGNQVSVLLNGYYDLKIYKKFVPYLTVGAGISRLNTGDFVLGNLKSYHLRSKKMVRVAWNIGAGASYVVQNKYALDAGYLYTNFGETKLYGIVGEPPSHQSFQAHTFSLGLRVFI